jgi:hypothetical protein
MNALKKLWIYSCWGASALKEKLGDSGFWGAAITATFVGAFFSSAIYVAEGGSSSERTQPRKYTNSPAAEFNVVSSVKLPEALCPDLGGATYTAAKNDADKYVIVERRNDEPTLDVLDKEAQQGRIAQIGECLDEASKLNAEELVDFGWDLKFAAQGKVFGPIKMQNVTENKTAVVYDFHVYGYESFYSLEDEVKEIQKHLLMDDMRILSADKLSDTWRKISSDIADHGFAEHRAENLPTVEITLRSWSGYSKFAGAFAAGGLVLGGGLGFCISGAASASAARREKYQSKLNAVGRDVIM